MVLNNNNNNNNNNNLKKYLHGQCRVTRHIGPVSPYLPEANMEYQADMPRNASFMTLRAHARAYMGSHDGPYGFT